ncbi:uncharacterized protein G2W53_035160 [Senna tora]|uniref:Uncharacterized protein n=1 Tax=Senna tora TaxID=362788 RepID=A0A834W3Q9_9FABA|nr:uncharacterized protein G2W53_035160 [Senna tora]
MEPLALGLRHPIGPSRTTFSA